MDGFVIACVKLLSADTRRFGGAITRDNAMTMTVRQIHSHLSISSSLELRRKVAINNKNVNDALP